MLRADLRFGSQDVKSKDAIGAISHSELALFQCAQSEFDRVSWPLYRSGAPALSRMLGPGRMAVPLINGYTRKSALATLARAGDFQRREAAEAPSR
jgi:hypothetical protein